MYEYDEYIDIHDDEYDDGEEYRNAGPRDHRGGSRDGGLFGLRRPRRPGRRPRPRPRPPVIRPREPRGPVRPRPPIVHPSGPIADHGGYLTISKDALAEFVPAIGKVYASFLQRPEGPVATGNDTVDRDNATMHRDALAQHSQSQTRILALSELAGRALKLFA
jgi:hypothetical protein